MRGPVGAVAIPYGGARCFKMGKFCEITEKIAIFTHDSPGNMKGIATPVCPLARNDVLFNKAIN